jgi:hypothetical protein
LENHFASGRAIADEFLQLLALKARDAAFCNGAYGDNVGSTHEDWHFARELTGVTEPEHPTLANDVFDRFEFTFEDDKEARILTFTDEPLSGLEGNVGSSPRQAPPFLFFNACKEGNFFELSRGNHCVLLAYRRWGLHVRDLVQVSTEEPRKGCS